MKITTSFFGLALVGLTASSAQQTDQQLCPDFGELFSNPDYQATNCMLVDFPDDCNDCVTVDANTGVDYVPGGIDCNTMEEQVCPSIRCCENCWEKLQNYYQCFLVEPVWKSKGGLVEDGCVLDCSRFPFGGVRESPNDDNDSIPIADTANNSDSASLDTGASEETISGTASGGGSGDEDKGETGVLESIGDMGSQAPLPAVAISMLSWNTGMVVLVGALAVV